MTVEWFHILGIEKKEELQENFILPRTKNILNGYQSFLREYKIEPLDNKILRLDKFLVGAVVERYLKQLAQMKLTNSFPRTTWDKVGGYLGYWFIRVRPVQLVKAIDSVAKAHFLYSVNEIIGFNLGLGLELGNSEKLGEILELLKENNRFWSTIQYLKSAPLVPDLLVREFQSHQIWGKR